MGVHSYFRMKYCLGWDILLLWDRGMGLDFRDISSIWMLMSWLAFWEYWERKLGLRSFCRVQTILLPEAWTMTLFFSSWENTREQYPAWRSPCLSGPGLLEASNSCFCVIQLRSLGLRGWSLGLSWWKVRKWKGPVVPGTSNLFEIMCPEKIRPSGCLDISRCVPTLTSVLSLHLPLSSQSFLKSPSLETMGGSTELAQLVEGGWGAAKRGSWFSGCTWWEWLPQSQVEGVCGLELWMTQVAEYLCENWWSGPLNSGSHMDLALWALVWPFTLQKVLEVRRVQEERNFASAFSLSLCHLGHEEPGGTAALAMFSHGKMELKPAAPWCPSRATVGAVDLGVESS